MDIKNVTLVAALFDIGRDNWDNFTMSYNTYMWWMRNLLFLDANLVIYTEEKFKNEILSYRKQVDPNLEKTKLIIQNLEDIDGYKLYYEPLTTLMESDGFIASIENLNYSADRLLVIFSKYFKSNASALACHRQPIKIGSKVYANRMGNGDEASGEGYKYRGRGAIQLTGKDNYKAFASYVGDLSIIENPDLVATKYFFDSALFFFTRNKVWSLCKKVSDENILLVTRKINGGTNGLLDRQNKTKKYYNLIK